MASSEPARTAPRRPIRVGSARVAGLLVVLAAIAAALGLHDRGSSTSSTTASSVGVAAGEHRGRLGQADGAVPDGTTVFDDAVAGVGELDPDLLGALRRAATDAAGEGVAFRVDSGWRSRDYQEQLLQEAISKYGSEAEATRWVATPDTSAHVSGDAIDLGRDAAAWLSQHGAAYGLCRVYGNEPWHFELRPAAVDHGCPPTYADPSRDPRMRR